MADVVGTAYVRIRAITTGIGKDIKDAIEEGMDFDAFAKDFKANLSKATKGATDEQGRIIKRETKKHRTDFEKQWGQSFKKFAKFKIPGKFWLAALGIPALGGALKIAGAYLTTLVAQLGYVVTAAVGVGGALAGAIGLGLIGLVPLVLAFKTETEALDKFKKSLEEQADAWKEVGSAVQEGLLPPLTEATQLLSSEFIPLFTDLGRELGSIFGDVVRRISNVLTTEGAMQSWAKVFESVGPFMTAIGDALVQVARLLPPLLEVTAPLAVDLAQALQGAAKNFADFITLGAESGTLSTNLSLWWDRAKLIGAVLWNVVEALWEIFRVGADVVSPQFENLRDITQGWVDFLRSDEGQDNLKRIFENALPVAQEVNGLLGDLIEMIASPILEGETGGVIAFLQSIRDDWLPLVEQLAGMFGDELGESLTTFVESVLTLFQELADSGALGTFLDTMIKIVDTLTDLMQIPGFRDFVITFLQFYGVMAAFSKIPGVGLIFGGIGKGLGTFLGKKTDAALGIFTDKMGSLVKLGWDKLKGGIGGFFGVLKGVAGKIPWGTIFSSLGTLAASLWGVISPLLPIIAIIAAVVAAIAGIIWVIKNWDKVTKFLSETWENIVEVFNVVWDAVKNFFGNLGGIISEKAGQLWEWIQDAIPKAIGAIGRFIGGIISFLVSLPGKILTMMIEGYKALFGWIADAIPVALHWLGELIGNILGFILLLPVRIALFLFEGISAFWDWIVEATPKVLGFLGDLITNIMDFITKLPGRIVAGLKAGVTALWGWIRDAVPKVVEWLGNIWKNITNWFTETLPKLIARGVEMLTGFLKWIVDAAVQIPGKLAAFAVKVWNWITDFIGEIPERLAAGIDAVIGFGEDIVAGIVEGLTNAIDTVWDWAGEFIDGIIDGIRNQAAKLGLGWVVDKIFGKSSGGGGGNNSPQTTTTTPVPTAAFAGFSALAAAVTPLVLAGAGSTASSALTGNTSPRSATGVNLIVQIGERDITDIVDARISDNDMATSQALFVTRRG